MLMHNKATGDVSWIAACFRSWPRAAGQWRGSGGETKQKLTGALGEAEACMPEEQNPVRMIVNTHNQTESNQMYDIK